MVADQLFACQVFCHLDLDKSTESMVESRFNVLEMSKGSSERVVKQEIAMWDLRALI
jgi:hypothetical protein